MKKKQLSAGKLQFKKEKVTSLTAGEAGFFLGGGNVDQCTVTNQPRPKESTNCPSTWGCFTIMATRTQLP